MTFELAKVLWFDKINIDPKITPPALDNILRGNESTIGAMRGASSLVRGTTEPLGLSDFAEPQSQFAYVCAATVLNLKPPAGLTQKQQNDWAALQANMRAYLQTVLRGPHLTQRLCP